MARKTRTPKALSVIRKFWTYVGNAGLMAAFTTDMFTAKTLVLIMFIYNAIGLLIQAICDTYFIAEKPDDFKPEPNKIKD